MKAVVRAAWRRATVSGLRSCCPSKLPFARCMRAHFDMSTTFDRRLPAGPYVSPTHAA
jgi:hypothetical protein